MPKHAKPSDLKAKSRAELLEELAKLEKKSLSFVDKLVQVPQQRNFPQSERYGKM
jgi:hypothetical protein